MTSRHTASLGLFDRETPIQDRPTRRGNTIESLPRLDVCSQIRERILPFCRVKHGQIWEDPLHGHRVGVLDATDVRQVESVLKGETTSLVIADPPYNIPVGNANTDSLFSLDLSEYMQFSERWVRSALAVMKANASLYVWLGADYKRGLQPLPDFMILMRQFQELRPRNIITVRNQRGYGTRKNWMWVRQELLYYVKGDPEFNVQAEYTAIPKILAGYYKTVHGRATENLERSKSPFIRAGNVWVDIQQVFYRLEENVSGCYAQKPLKAIERIILSATQDHELVLDLFCHSGSTLIAAERTGRRVCALDIDPVFAEITIRRLEHLRATGKTGWQWRNPFPELDEEVFPARGPKQPQESPGFVD